MVRKMWEFNKNNDVTPSNTPVCQIYFAFCSKQNELNSFINILYPEHEIQGMSMSESSRTEHAALWVKEVLVGLRTVRHISGEYIIVISALSLQPLNLWCWSSSEEHRANSNCKLPLSKYCPGSKMHFPSSSLPHLHQVPGRILLRSHQLSQLSWCLQSGRQNGSPWAPALWCSSQPGNVNAQGIIVNSRIIMMEMPQVKLSWQGSHTKQTPHNNSVLNHLFLQQ